LEGAGGSFKPTNAEDGDNSEASARSSADREPRKPDTLVGLSFLVLRALRLPIALERTKAIARAASRKASISIGELSEDRQNNEAKPTLKSPNLVLCSAARVNQDLLG